MMVNVITLSIRTDRSKKTVKTHNEASDQSLYFLPHVLSLDTFSSTKMAL